MLEDVWRRRMRDWEIEEIERGVCFVFMAVRWKEEDYLWRSARLRDICRNEAHADCGFGSKATT